MGNVIQGGVGQAPARQALLKAGVPATVSALTINKVCGSGLKAVMLAAQSIKAGDAQVIVAGGQESMSNAPYYVYGMRNGVKLGDQKMVDGMIKDGLWCAVCDVHMGGHAEYTAKKAGLTRAQQDEFAAESHAKAVAAQQGGKFAAEIVPVQRSRAARAPTVVDTDEGPRADTTAESLAKLRPAFPDKGDAGRRALGHRRQRVVAERRRRGARRDERGVRAGARAADPRRASRPTRPAPTNPQDLFFAPITAVQNLMKKAGTTIGDYDLIEANEAFASQALADGAGARAGTGTA